MKVKDLMTTNVRTIRPESSLIHAAQIMKELDIGAIPVCDGEEILGMVTDRDIILNAIAEGLSPEQTQILDIYQKQDVVWVYEHEDLSAAAQLMEMQQVRRLIVLDKNKNLVGLLSLGDLAKADSPRQTGKTLQKITESLPHS